jgi:hypothetical protein
MKNIENDDSIASPTLNFVALLLLLGSFRKHLRMQGRTKTGINTDEV